MPTEHFKKKYLSKSIKGRGSNSTGTTVASSRSSSSSRKNTSSIGMRPATLPTFFLTSLADTHGKASKKCNGRQLKSSDSKTAVAAAAAAAATTAVAASAAAAAAAARARVALLIA